MFLSYCIRLKGTALIRVGSWVIFLFKMRLTVHKAAADTVSAGGLRAGGLGGLKAK